MINISFVIPCKNEESNISKCINSVLKQSKHLGIIDVVVVDNGSIDQTVSILAKYGKTIEVYSLDKGASISQVRNCGANISKAEWIAFIDADVELALDWGYGLKKVLYDLDAMGIDLTNVITGATYSIPADSTWVQRIWYQQLACRDRDKQSYINGGNLIVNRKLFSMVGGFNPNCATGEDVKFCEDALAAGAKIFKDESIKSFHHGYPKSVTEFFKRERWHGLGMKWNLCKPWRSRDLSFALYNLVCIISLLIMWIMSGSVIMSFLFYTFSIISPILLLSIKRCNKRYGTLIPLSFLYLIYGYARLLSLMDIILGILKRVY